MKSSLKTADAVRSAPRPTVVTKAWLQDGRGRVTALIDVEMPVEMYERAVAAGETSAETADQLL